MRLIPNRPFVYTNPLSYEIVRLLFKVGHSSLRVVTTRSLSVAATAEAEYVKMTSLDKSLIANVRLISIPYLAVLQKEATLKHIVVVSV